MRAALIIARRILVQRLRDRSAILFAVLTPLGLAVAFSALIAGSTSSFHTTFAVVDDDQGTFSQVLVGEVLGGLSKAGVADIVMVPTESAAREEVSSDRAGAAIVIPAGLSTAIQTGAPTRITILGGPGPFAREVALAAVGAFAHQVGALQLSIATSIATGGAADAATVTAATAAARDPSPIAVIDDAAERRQASLATFYGAAMAMMFLFFATQYGALALLGDRRVGTLNRLLAAPVSHASIVLGGALASFVMGLVSMTTLMIATTVLRGAYWGPPLPVALLILGAAFSAMGFSLLISTLARTAEQAGGLNAIAALSMAAIGGVFIPLSQAPEVMTRIAQITPHAWFLHAIDTLAVPTAGLADVLPSILVLLAMGAVTAAVGLSRARRSLVTA
jgi:ABC-2 type transport system permease protein